MPKRLLKYKAKNSSMNGSLPHKEPSGSGSLPRREDSNGHTLDRQHSQKRESTESVTLADFDSWPDAPCLLFAHPCLIHDGERRVRINVHTPFTFETDLFKGEALLFIDGLPSSPPDLFKVCFNFKMHVMDKSLCSG